MLYQLSYPRGLHRLVPPGWSRCTWTEPQASLHRHAFGYCQSGMASIRSSTHSRGFARLAHLEPFHFLVCTELLTIQLGPTALATPIGSRKAKNSFPQTKTRTPCGSGLEGCKFKVNYRSTFSPVTRVGSLTKFSGLKPPTRPETSFDPLTRPATRTAAAVRRVPSSVSLCVDAKSVFMVIRFGGSVRSTSIEVVVMYGLYTCFAIVARISYTNLKIFSTVLLQSSTSYTP